MAESGERQRPRLNLKPRDEAAAAKIALERAASAKNPFGAAKPREAVLAVREGKREEDILKEDLQKDKIHLRLNGAQQREKDAAEAAIADIKQTLELEEDESKKDLLRAQVKSSEAKLEEMLSTFEKLAIEQAKSGGGIRPSVLRAEQGFAQQGGGGRSGDQFGEGFGGRGGGRGGFQEGGYGNGRPGSFESGGGFGGGGRGGGGYDRGFQQDSRGGYNRGAGGYDQYGGGGGGGYDQYAAGPPDPTFDSFGGGSYGGGGGGRGRGGGRGGGGGRHQYGQGGGEEGGFGGGQDRF